MYTNLLFKGLIFFPYIILYAGSFVDPYNSSIGTLIKFAAFPIMLVLVFLLNKYSIKLIIVSLLSTIVLVLNFNNGFSINASVYSFVKYLTPILCLFYGFAIRRHIGGLIKLFFSIVIINDLIHLLNLLLFILGLPTLVPLMFEGLLVRGTGGMGNPGTFGFINAMAFLLAWFNLEGEQRKYAIWFFGAFVLMSLSYRIVGPFFFILFILSKHKLRYVSLSISIFIIGFISLPDVYQGLGFRIASKLDHYLFVGNSARYESYRVMVESAVINPHIFGYGTGSFGGPASTMYDSPVYDLYNFNWYYTTDLTTTDTYFPHPFVELGVLGGLIYLSVFFVPFLASSRNRNPTYFYMLLLAFSSSLMTFGLNDFQYLFAYLPFAYGLQKLEPLHVSERLA